MSGTSRFALTTWIFAMIATGLYSCSGSDASSVPGEDPENRSATPAGGEAAAPSVDGNADSGGPPPQACAFFDTAPGRALDLGPAACARCAAERCCAPITKCYGAAPVDAGSADGAAGSKTACQLFGECEDRCNLDVACDEKCALQYGAPIADDWGASEDCIGGAPPAGCAELCY